MYATYRKCIHVILETFRIRISTPNVKKTSRFLLSLYLTWTWQVYSCPTIQRSPTCMHRYTYVWCSTYNNAFPHAYTYYTCISTLRLIHSHENGATIIHFSFSLDFLMDELQWIHSASKICWPVMNLYGNPWWIALGLIFFVFNQELEWKR